MYSMLVISEQSDNRNMMRIHRRHLQDTTNAFEMPGERFRELYRFTKATANVLLGELSPPNWPLANSKCVAMYSTNFSF